MDHACGDHVLVTRHGKGDVLAGQELPAQGEGFFRSKQSQELDRAQFEGPGFIPASCSRMLSSSVKSTTPGTRGLPGKCPAKAGWSRRICRGLSGRHALLVNVLLGMHDVRQRFSNVRVICRWCSSELIHHI